MRRQDRGATNSGHNSFNKNEIIGGRQAVLEALRCGKPQQILLVEGQKGMIINEIMVLARRQEVSLEILSKGNFNNVAGNIDGNQGVAAIVPPFQYFSLTEIIDTAKASARKPFLIMLDHIEDPHNLGAVMRTADAAGISGLIIPNRRAASVNATARKVAAGAAERLPVAMVGNLNQAAETLKKEGFWLYGAEAGADIEFYRPDYLLPLVLVIGSEKKGISQLLRQRCDLLISIPMPGSSAGSLNVSVAAALIVYAALSRREGWST